MTYERGSKMKSTISEEVFMNKLLNDFRGYVLDSMSDGMHKEFDDHFLFLKGCLEGFIDDKESESESTPIA